MNGEHKTRNVAIDLIRVIGFGLLIASVVRELRLPKQRRTWHGVVFGRVPYDLRPPTIARLKGVIWNRSNQQLLGRRLLELAGPSIWQRCARGSPAELVALTPEKGALLSVFGALDRCLS